MIRAFASLAILSLATAGCGVAPRADSPIANGIAPAAKVAEDRAAEPLPDVVRVKLETEAGAIVVALGARRPRERPGAV